MITADQILAHLVGDYILQSDWMANGKTRQSFAAAVHALCYSLPFLFFRPSFTAFAFIAVTHFVIDRWRLARYVCWLKNWIAPPVRCIGLRSQCSPVGGCPIHGHPERRIRWTLAECAATGYSPMRPIWLATWLLIIADNTLHLICNGIALHWL